MLTVRVGMNVWRVSVSTALRRPTNSACGILPKFLARYVSMQPVIDLLVSQEA